MMFSNAGFHSSIGTSGSSTPRVCVSGAVHFFELFVGYFAPRVPFRDSERDSALQ